MVVPIQNQKSILTNPFSDFQHIDIMDEDEKYDFLEFNDLESRVIFRHEKKWYVKTSPHYARIISRKNGYCNLTFLIDDNPFVAIVKGMRRDFSY